MGGFYSQVHSQIVPGISLLSPKDIKDTYTETINHPTQRNRWTSALNKKEKLELLDINLQGTFSFDLQSGSQIRAGGHLEWLDDEKVNKFYRFV